MFTGDALVPLHEARALSRRSEDALERTGASLRDVIDQQVHRICDALAEATDPFQVRVLRMELAEWQGPRRRIVEEHMQALWARERTMLETFLRYRHGLLERGHRAIDLLAEVEGVDTAALKSDFGAFKRLLRSEWKLEVADSVAQELYVRQLEEQLHEQQDARASRLLDAGDRYAKKRLGRY